MDNSGQPPPGASAKKEPAPAFLTRWHEWIPIAVFVCLAIFVVVSAIASMLRTSQGETWRNSPFLALIALTIAFGAWFIACFTGDPDEKDREKQSFRFAYVFTMTTFVVLIFPMTNPWQPDISGPIGLIRGCVEGNGAPEAIACVAPSKQSATTNVGQKIEGESPQSNAAPASDVQQATDARASDAANTGAQNNSSSTNSQLSAEYVWEQSYPWLIVIGGSYGVVAKAPPKAVQKADATNSSPASHPLFSKIRGGFVVPYYIVLLAFIGGAISLTRRIPEYQKQSESGYVGTEAAPKLDSYETRENVVFEIMQLITAPFIAMVAFYALAPSTTAGGIALAFISGFSSSLILLQLRGMLEGLYPAATKLSSSAAAIERGDLSGVVTDADKKPLAGATVAIKELPAVQPVQTDDKGQFSFKQLPSGALTVVASLGEGNGTANVTVTANAVTTTAVALTSGREASDQPSQQGNGQGNGQ